MENNFRKETHKTVAKKNGNSKQIINKIINRKQYRNALDLVYSQLKQLTTSVMFKKSIQLDSVKVGYTN